MPIEVTWTDEDYDAQEEQPKQVGHGADEEENLSRSPYSGDDEYEEDEDNNKSRQIKFDEQWQQLNAVSGGSADPQDLHHQEVQPLEPELQPQEGQEQDGQLNEGQMGEESIKSNQSPLVAVEATYTVKPSSSHREEDSYLCGLASIILEHCDPRGSNKVEDSTTQVTLITQMDSQNDPMVDTSGEWENLVPKGMETPDKAFLPIPWDDQDNQSMDGSLRSTRTTDTQETERTAIETELAPSAQPPTRTKSRRKSSFLKWSKPTSSKKKSSRGPIIIPPVEKEPRLPPTTAVNKDSAVPSIPAPMEISASSLNLQREVSLLEFDDVDADKNLRIIGLSPTSSFDRENSVLSPTPITDDGLSEGSYYDEDEATLLSDSGNNHTYMVKPIQCIEVIYDPNLFDEEEEKVGEGTRYCSLWPVGAKKSRGRLYR